MENNSQSKLDAVRDLIFGATLSEYEAKVEQLERKVESNNEHILLEISSLRSKLNDSISLMEKNIIERIENLYNAAKTELDRQNTAHVSREKMAQLLIQFAKEL
jgi:DNA topoisomerase IA